MPKGVVQWFDAKTGEGRVVKAGQRYLCVARDMAPATRVAGARVQFDIGEDGMTALRIMPSRRHGGRSGQANLSGAHSPWSEQSPRAAARIGAARDVDRRRPIRLARLWSEAVARGDLADALALYAPTAELHAADGQVHGQAKLDAALRQLAPFGGHHPAWTIAGDGDDVVVRWEGSPSMAPCSTRLHVQHGEIVRQWIDVVPEAAPSTARAFPVQTTTQGAVGAGVVRYATDKLVRLAEQLPEPVLFARVKLRHHADPAASRPALAEALIDVNGTAVRAHVAATELTEAVDLLDRRLRQRLAVVGDARGWTRPVEVEAEPGEWRHGNLPMARPTYFERPQDEREIVRHKSWTPEELTVDEAVFDLETLDYGFYLFHELVTGQDSVVSSEGGDHYRLQQLNPDPAAVEHAAADVQLRAEPPPCAELREMVERLDAGAERFVFFQDPTTTRGCVLYRRYDGHYGLITAGVD